jgi:hypothetical protein
MAEPGGRDLLSEWRGLMDSVIGSATAATGRSQLPRDLLGAMQRQFELAQELVERERWMQRDLVGRLTAPVDAAFDLLEETAHTLRRQAEALEAAGRALEETARLMKRQAELFERTVGTLRQPADRAKALAGLQRRPSKGAGQRRSTSRPQKPSARSGAKRPSSGGSQRAKGAGQRQPVSSSQRRSTSNGRRRARSAGTGPHSR